MKWKLDENLGSRTANILRAAGHDVETVLQEQLCGASDEVLFEVCIREKRCLLTMDVDFADIVRFPPHRSPGIAVLRLPMNPSRSLLEGVVARLMSALSSEPIDRKLWIVESGRIRVRDESADQ